MQTSAMQDAEQDPEWYEETSFYTAQVQLGGDDAAEVVCATMETTELLDRIDELSEQKDTEEFYDALEELFIRNVRSFELTEAEKHLGHEVCWDPEADPDQRERMLRGMPVRVVMRIVAGIGHLAGN